MVYIFCKRMSGTIYSSCASGGSTLDQCRIRLRDLFVGASLSEFQIFDPARLFLDQPKCPNCGSLMWLIRNEPDEPNCDRRTFQCEGCDHAHIEVVKYR